MVETADAPAEQCLAEWCAGEQWCAITCTMAVIGGKWHPVIVDRLLQDGPLRFNELNAELGPITNKVLSQSLGDLEADGVVDREIVSERPVAVAYSLTERGESLAPVIESLGAWGRSYLREADREGEAA